MRLTALAGRALLIAGPTIAGCLAWWQWRHPSACMTASGLVTATLALALALIAAQNLLRDAWLPYAMPAARLLVGLAIACSAVDWAWQCFRAAMTMITTFLLMPFGPLIYMGQYLDGFATPSAALGATPLVAAIATAAVLVARPQTLVLIGTLVTALCALAAGLIAGLVFDAVPSLFDPIADRVIGVGLSIAALILCAVIMIVGLLEAIGAARLTATRIGHAARDRAR